MANKFIDYLIWVVLITISLGISWLLIEPIIWWTDKSEIRICVRLFLLLMLVSTFSTLRLYNAIVQNTLISYKLRETLNKFSLNTSVLDRAMRNLNSSLGNARASIEGLKKSTDKQTDEITELINKMNKK